ncbi:hypothetical protein [Noviherbaspirillum saxi]|uniref:Uncharacterized protein n=1 Tax=Noviherbaspirillum saxi TaxID=2320863 RepID=A0A3A3GA37_9BURK|nr:hypothetical protein [Noviherbaspirillum saxi]RJF99015.1 hypothetical protein D3871_11220 [Noviherbaspirillum saxi]
MKKTDASKTANSEKKPATEPVSDAHKVLATDEHAGRGGSYVFDPAAGKRTPVPETQPEKEST